MQRRPETRASQVIQILIPAIVLCLILNQLAAPSIAHACTCLPPLPTVTSKPTLTPEQKMAPYEAVFLGKVIQIDDPGEYSGKSVILEVYSSWKGVSKSQVRVRTGSGNGDCGFTFQINTTYVVYAYGSVADNELGTTICSSTARVANEGENGYGKVVTQDDIRALGESRSPSENVTLAENVTLVGSETDSETDVIIYVSIGLVIVSALTVVGLRLALNRHSEKA